jgi:hypothetical protein
VRKAPAARGARGLCAARLAGRAGQGRAAGEMEAGAAQESPTASRGAGATPAAPAAASQASGGKGESQLDFELPLTAVVRILKRKLPEGVAVSKEAKVAFAKSAGMFILYITAAYVAR